MEGLHVVGTQRAAAILFRREVDREMEIARSPGAHLRGEVDRQRSQDAVAGLERRDGRLVQVADDDGAAVAVTYRPVAGARVTRDEQGSRHVIPRPEPRTLARRG